MRFRRFYFCVFAVPALALCAAGQAASQSAAQNAPRLDGGGAQLPAGWAAAAAAANRANANKAGANMRPPKAGMAMLGTTPVAAAPPASASAVPDATASAAPSPADRPAQPASVAFQGGMLTVHATNSSLAQILTDTSTQTGMALEGVPEDERVFGDFGPAPVDKVLAQLLDGGASNYLLFGRKANQAPRALVITPRASLAPGVVMASSAATMTPVSNDDEDDDDAPAPAPAPIRPLIPNAQGNGSSGINGINGSNGGPPQVRTPQQILDDMQRRRQEQQTQIAPD